MTILEFINKYVVVINTIILLILVFRYLQDLRRYNLDYKKLNLEHEKLKIELEQLRGEMKKSSSTIVEASPDQINKYVIEPLSEEIRKAASELGGRVESFSQSQSELKHGLARQLRLTQDLAEIPTDMRKELHEIIYLLKHHLEIITEIRVFLTKLQKLRLQIGLGEEA